MKCVTESQNRVRWWTILAMKTLTSCRKHAGSHLILRENVVLFRHQIRVLFTRWPVMQCKLWNALQYTFLISNPKWPTSAESCKLLCWCQVLLFIKTVWVVADVQEPRLTACQSGTFTCIDWQTVAVQFLLIMTCSLQPHCQQAVSSASSAYHSLQSSESAV